MNEALRLKFRGRLFTVGRERHRRATSGFDAGDPETIRAELHALAGEAHMLGEAALATAAGEGERAALRWRNGDEVDTERARAGRALAELRALLDAEEQEPGDE